MGAMTAVSGGLGIVGGIYNTIQGAKQANEAKDALENYERQKLENVAEGLQVSTLGADLQREEQSRLASGQVGALREGGTRSLIGGLGRVSQANQMVNREIGANLDMQQKQIDQMRAEDEARIRAMQENREIQDISALSSQINTGEQVKANGLSQAIQGTSMIGNAFSPRVPQEGQYSAPYTTSGSPSGSTSSFYQSPIENRMDANYQLDSYGQPSTYINPFSLRNPYQPTKR